MATDEDSTGHQKCASTSSSLHCRDMTRQLHSSEDCPRKVNGRRQGVMELTKRFWDEKGYQNLERTAQNLHDKIGHIEKSSQTAAAVIDNRELKQTDAAAVNQQISIQKDSRPSEFSRPLTLFTL